MPQVFSLVFAVKSGNRMKSKKSKSLHEICGETILTRLIRVAKNISPNNCIIALNEHDREYIEKKSNDTEKYLFFDDNKYESQAKMLNAVLSQTFTTNEKSCANIFILTPDYPLIKAETLLQAYDCHVAEGNACTVVTTAAGSACSPDEPVASGKTRTASTISGANSRIICANIKLLLKVSAEAATLDDIPGLLAKSGEKVETFLSGDPDELTVVCDRITLSKAEAIRRKRINKKHMENGVTLIDPETTYIQAGIRIGMDTVIYPGTYLENFTEIGDDCVIGPNTLLSGMKVGTGSEVRYSTGYDSVIGAHTKVGPYAYIRPGSDIGSDVKVGDFVEIKKSKIGDGTKISHLAYVGDAEVGSNVNIGCGVVFANYDGKNKNKAVVGDNAFIGSNSNLIAPVSVGTGAFVAAGSTITDDIPQDSFAIARERQVTKDGYMLTKRDKQQEAEHAAGGKK